MEWSSWPLLSATLLLICLASFNWAMRNFFSRPDGVIAGTQLIRITGAGFAVLHLGAIAATPAPTARQALIAACIYLSALGLFWWAIRTSARRTFSSAFSADLPVHLVERGPYRFIRHPLYSSYLLTWTAGVVASGRLWLLPSVAVMLAVYLQAAKMEEDKFSRSPLASAYQRYRSRTGMFFPNLIKLNFAQDKSAGATGLTHYRA